MPSPAMATTAACDALAGHGHNGGVGRTRRPRHALAEGGEGEPDEHGEEGKDADGDHRAMLQQSRAPPEVAVLCSPVARALPPP
jgi:hypothetical protein